MARFFAYKRLLIVGWAMVVSLFTSHILLRGSDTDQVSFINDVVPVLTKAGCNTGACHAKAVTGQNGFQLSLFGFQPDEDYEHLTKEARGRRLSLASPEKSLLLLKASADVPHGGGLRLKSDSQGYELVRRWIEQGAGYTREAELQIVAFEVQPQQSTAAMGSQKQLKALAHYSDASIRDVTSLAVYESNDKARVIVDEQGVVTISDIPGRAAIMVRYQAHVAVSNFAIPLSEAAIVVPQPKTFVDRFVFENLQEIGVAPSPECDDATFLRRASLDITGCMPSVEQAKEFLSNTNTDKRDRYIDSLLQSSEYADYFANKWTALLKNRRDDASDIVSNFAFHAWVRDSLLANKRYDQLVRELLGATGTVIGNPPVAWYKRVKEPKEQLEDVAQLFLGVRMQCAQCHHHPFERWSQDDYYALSAFFSQVGRKPSATRGEDLIFHKRGIAGARNPKTSITLKPAALGDAMEDIPADDDPRLRLVDWMSDTKNPFFAKAVVNRYWKHFFGRGLIEPEDDIRDTNPPTNPKLLAALEAHFISSGFDLKDLVRTITRSQTYQFSFRADDRNRSDTQNFSRFYPKRLPAEVLLDAIDQLTGATTTFNNLPAGTRAIALPDNSYNNSSPFLKVFGRPESASVCECERTQSSSLSQSLHLINAADIRAKLSTPKGRADRFATENRPPLENTRELYIAAFSREPTSAEVLFSQTYLAEPRTDSEGKPLDVTRALQENYEDLLWAVINTKEFLFNH